MKNWQRLKAVLVCAFPLAMAGCGSGKDEIPKFQTVVVDLSAARCPDLDPRYAKEFTTTVGPPKGDDLPEETTKAKIDEFRVAVRKKNGTGNALIADYLACQNKEPATSAVH